MMIIMAWLVRFVQLTVVLMTGGFLSIGLWGTLSLTQVRTVTIRIVFILHYLHFLGEKRVPRHKMIK